MEDIRKKREQAIKTKSSATILIIIGSVSLLFAGVLVAASMMSAHGANLPGGNPISEIAGILGCCISIAILFGLVGILLFSIGLHRRDTANQELATAEEDNRMLRTQMLAEEERRKQP